MAEDRNNMPRDGGRDAEGQMSEAEIDANVEGTFPASDPPSWTLGTDHGGEPDADRPEAEMQPTSERRAG